jgi:hypothetical protein
MNNTVKNNEYSQRTRPSEERIQELNNFITSCFSDANVDLPEIEAIINSFIEVAKIRDKVFKQELISLANNNSYDSLISLMSKFVDESKPTFELRRLISQIKSHRLNL